MYFHAWTPDRKSSGYMCVYTFTSILFPGFYDLVPSCPCPSAKQFGVKKKPRVMVSCPVTFLPRLKITSLTESLSMEQAMPLGPQSSIPRKQLCHWAQSLLQEAVRGFKSLQLNSVQFCEIKPSVLPPTLASLGSC